MLYILYQRLLSNLHIMIFEEAQPVIVINKQRTTESLKPDLLWLVN